MSVLVANAILDAQERCAAALLAAGVARDRVLPWHDPSPDCSDCGIKVDGEVACVITTTKSPGLVEIDVVWNARWYSTVATIATAVV